MPYSWYNVATYYNNYNTLKFTHDSGTTWTTITLPNRNYTYSDINAYIQQTLENNGHSKTGIKLEIVPSLFRVLITLVSNYQLDFRNSEFTDLLGFNKTIINATGYGVYLPDLTRSIDNIFIHTNIMSNSILSRVHSDVSG